MDKITVYIGSIVTLSNGAQQDTRREVVFEGMELGTYREYGEGRDGRLTDTRGTTQTLYKTADGRFVVHVDNWSHWQGEPNTETLHEVKERDLQPGGRFYDLAVACDLGRPLTLEEALNEGDETDRFMNYNPIDPKDWTPEEALATADTDDLDG